MNALGKLASNVFLCAKIKVGIEGQRLQQQRVRREAGRKGRELEYNKFIGSGRLPLDFSVGSLRKKAASALGWDAAL